MFKRTSTADDVRRVLVTALIAALEDQQKQKQSSRRGLTGMKALATGAVLFTAGRAGTRLLSDRLQAVSDGREDEDEYDEDEEYDEEEPEAEAEYDDDEEYEDEADEDEEYEDEPEAEADEDEDEEDEEYEDEDESAAERPSRSRAPAGRS